MALVFALAVAVLGYVYVGYPALLHLVVRLRGRRGVRQADATPRLSLVISAYNEADVIGRKLENALALDYPPGQLEIVVISDASDDGTDEIVTTFSERGVRLARQAERRGKTAGLNFTVPGLSGEIVVFSDANAMYERDALLKLTRNFADPEVGCVTGEARYIPGDGTAAGVGERVYWDYEIQLKRLETALGSMVGGDGAIYAIRRSLWRELPENAINDFLNPLQIVGAGWRAVYEPDAICYEDAAGAVGSEYRRRVRIVSRSWRAVFQAPGVLNPLRVGLFTWSLVSHKMLRWLSGIFAVLAIASALALFIPLLANHPLATLTAVLAGSTVIGATRAGRRIAALMGYFAVIYAASILGVIKGSLGHVSGVWATPRHPAGAGSSRFAAGRVIHVGPLLLTAGTAACVAMIVVFALRAASAAATVVFWTSAAIVTYVYAGYPLILAVLKRVAARPVRVGAFEPAVCLFITAHNESGVMAAKLRNALALDYPPDLVDIVVASDGSQDRTNDVVREFAPRVRLLAFTKRRGKIATISEGIGGVTSDIVIFSDANTFLQPDAIRALVRNFNDPQVGAASGDVTLVGERAALARSEDLYYRYERWIQDAESHIGSMIGADGALYAIRRELFVAPPSDTILDDMAIPMAVIRAGRRVVFEPAACAYEHGSETAVEEFARKSRVVAGAVQFMRRADSALPVHAPQVIFSFVSHKALRWSSPVFAMSGFVAALTLAGSSKGYAAAALAQALVIAGGLAGCIPTLRRANAVAIAHYFCLVQAAAAVGFMRGLTGRQSVLWRRFARGPVAEDLSHAG
jgi:cellulose synthase/poly-beta-1,6-N-acetylglucosamine synthase-like glycosyltransferase